MSARTIPWGTIADWFAENEQQIRDVMKFEGLRGAVNEVLRIAPDQPELAALREELAECKRKHLRSCQIAIGKSQLAKERHAQLIEAEITRESWQNGYDVKCQNILMLTVANRSLRDLLREALPSLDLAAGSFKSAKPVRNKVRAALANPTESGASE